MDKARRKELLEQYKQTRPDMGVYACRCAETNRVYLGANQNLTGALNSLKTQLQNGSFPTNRRLLEEWERYGQDSFSLEILEKLDYDKDNEVKTDYREDLAILKEFWRERLMLEGAEVDNIKPRDR